MRQKPRLLKLACSYILLLGSLAVSGQKGVFVNARFIDGFNTRPVEIWKQPVKNHQAYGYQAGAYYNYPISKVDLRLGAGFKQMFFSGNRQFQEFQGNTTKLNIALQGFYKWTTVWAAGIGFGLENNRDFKDFRTKTTDNFRYNATVEIDYLLKPGLWIALGYSKAFSPYVDYYLLGNPSDQLSIGVNYKLPWP